MNLLPKRCVSCDQQVDAKVAFSRPVHWNKIVIENVLFCFEFLGKQFFILAVGNKINKKGIIFYWYELYQLFIRNDNQQ